MKLALGTAQLGRGYGISNTTGKVEETEVINIFKLASANGINTYDTAEDYGESEKILGDIKKSLNIKQQIITKTLVGENFERFSERLKKSLDLHKSDSVYGLLVHNPDFLIGPDAKGVFDSLIMAKKSGMAKKIGASVSSVDQANKIFDNFDLDIIQVPCNLFDQRFLEIIDSFSKNGIEVHIRSIFLQGLFFVDKLNEYFDDLVPKLDYLKLYAKNNSISVRKMAIDFSKSIGGVEKIIVGVDNASQLQDIIEDYTGCSVNCNFGKFSVSDRRFLNPADWPIGGWHE